MFGRLRSIVDGLIRRNRFEKAMADELRFHMEAFAADLVHSGVSQDEAARRARLEFGGTERVKEECRQARGLRWIDEVCQDLRYALRQMRQTPGFTLAALLSLALGIGANTAIFTLVEAVLLRTLPVPRPHELFFIGRDPGPRVSTSANFPLFERYQKVEAFAGVTSTWASTFRIADAGGVEVVSGTFASGNYHAVLEVPMAIGRGFTSEPDRNPKDGFIVVISDGYWARKFNRSPDALGKTLMIRGRPFTIVGVTTPAFNGMAPGRHLDVTLPMSARILDDPEFLDAHDGWLSLTIIGRLKPGVNASRATAEVDAVFQQFLSEPPNRWARENLAAEFKDVVFKSAALLPADRGTSALRTQYSTPLSVLMSMVAVVLLIACANVANLLLARATARAKEVAVRLSIGASRARLVRQFLTESLLLAIAGSAAGFVLALWVSDAIGSVFASGANPLRLDLAPDRTILAFTGGLCVLSTLVFGIVPAFRATRVELTPALKESSGFVGGRRGRAAVGKTLVVAQIALSVLVVSGAVLLGRSLQKLRTFDAGFQRANVLLFDLTTPPETFTGQRRATFYNELMDRLENHSGVVSAAYSLRSPIDFSVQRRRIDVPGGLKPKTPGVSANVVSPAYFETFDIPLLRGRLLAADDTANSPKVAVVSTEMARAFFGDADPIGRMVVLGADKAAITIVGIVKDVLHENLRGDISFNRSVGSFPPLIYTPLAQLGTPSDPLAGSPSEVTVELRTRQNPAAFQGSIPGEVRSVNKDAVVSYVRTMEEQVDASLGQERVLAVLSSGFALLALLLASVGLFGVMSYNVARRTREIGVRMALGATRFVVLKRVLQETMTVSVAGIAIGLAGALATTGLVARFLYELSPRDPGTFIATAIVLIATTMAAGWLPARRAASVDPTRALRNE